MGSVKVYREHVKQIRALFNQAESSWVDAIVLLRKVEVEELWKLARGGDRNFNGFIKTNFPDSIAFSLYRKSITAIETYGVEFIRKIGIRSCRALMVDSIVTDEIKKNELVSKLETYYDKYGVSPSISVVWSHVKNISPESIRATSTHPRLSEVLQENEKLRMENMNLKKENTKLKRKLIMGQSRSEILEIRA